MIISLSGKVGAGKGTTAGIICEKLGYEHIDVGGIKKKKAHDMGITIQEFNKLGDLPENVAAFDLSYEQYQQSLDVHSKIVLDSRLSAYNQPHSFRVRLLVSDDIAAHRLINDTRRFGDAVGNYDLILSVLKQRNDDDRQRYLDLYGFDTFEPNNYDLIINTDYLTATEVSEVILCAFDRWAAKQK